MKKHLVASAALFLFATGSQAATTYVLNNITYDNTFGTNPVICTGCGTGTAVDDGSGNITLTGIAWQFIGGGNNYTNSIDGTTTLAPTFTPVTSPANALPAGSDLIRTGGTCTDIIGTVCDPASLRSGWGVPLGFYTGRMSDGTTVCGGPATNLNSINRCRVDLAASGPNLTMEIKRALSESATSGSFQRMTFSFAVVPVPAAVWLFGSALGLLGVARRKSA